MKKTRKTATVALLVLFLLTQLFLSGCSALGAGRDDDPARRTNDLSDIKKIAVETGTVLDIAAQVLVPDAEIVYTQNTADSVMMLEVGKVDAYITDEPMARYAIREYPNHKILGRYTTEQYGFGFRKDDAFCATVRLQMNEYLAKIREDGTLAEIERIWFSGDESEMTVDLSGLSGQKLVIGLDVVTPPFTFMKDGELVGFEPAILVGFCREYGYVPEFAVSNFDGLITGLVSGKTDMLSACLTITAERQKSIDFSDPYYTGGVVLVVKDANAEGAGSGFFAAVGNSFYRTFVSENRWQMFVAGIAKTLLIAALSLLCGTLLGFGMYLLARRGNAPLNAVFGVINHIGERNPVVVILMVLYYIVFGRSDISGIWVAVIGFSILTAGSVFGTIKVGVSAIGVGQREAGLALGYSENQTFTQIVFPQAIKYILPGYKSIVISLVKETSVVGYIAVQDLTKIGDIVRSRTYEAFFPLIATAVLYYLIIALLIWVINLIDRRVNRRKKDPERILKGVGDDD